ncbi:hypothetical protein MJO28_011579 [Puccinia striiformis f. sp. tritici]|uniref:Uncharacterized protein n=1 Tax=Puccinia striiformis f. sp. tritici TaxID=168172 RepID=A0ACC0E333_9BASI|nr:hypothetical protein MJO28_011579 [Puccinia striiformis f. sp. tritici]
MPSNTNTVMPANQPNEDTQRQNLSPFDLVGIGFGPANLSLSVRLAEENLAESNQIARSRDQVTGVDGPNQHAETTLKACFIESNDCFRWHPGIFLKDLVTLRNPCSPFSFLNYLHCQKRLVDFINRATFTPTRLEFADYLAWVARHVTSSSPPSDSSSGTHDSGTRKENSLDLCYGERVVAVEGVRGPTGDIDFLRVSSTKSSNGSIRRYLCRNLVISAGGIPRVPEPFRDIGFESPKKSCHVIHTSTFLQHIDHLLSKITRSASAYPNQSEARANSRGTRQPIENLGLDRSNSPSSINSAPSTDGLTSCSSAAELESSDESRPEEPRKIKIAVIGAGQSAAETLLETYSRLKPLMASVNGLGTSGEIDLIIKQGHLRPSDDSPFSNEVFNPQSTDFFYELNAEELAPRSIPQPTRHGRKKVKDFLLEEAAATNYAVVNPETLSTLYETMYSQKVEQGMDKSQFGDWSQFNNVKINIINYTEIIAAEVNSSRDGSVDTVLENILTRTTTRARYDAVILGTGYCRQSWKGILFGKSVECPGPDINLRTLWPNLSLDTLHGFHPSSDPSNDDGLTNSDIVSNGLSDENDQASCLSEPSIETPIDLKIARNYRLLLPETFIEPNPSSVTSAGNENLRIRKFRPTVWLQGCNEGTHGISDSLLSVLSVRSGEIFDGIKEEGWFGNVSKATTRP